MTEIEKDIRQARFLTCFAMCTPGLEEVLHEEIKDLRFSRVEQQVGGVKFEGNLQDIYRANLELSTAFRILVEIGRFRVSSADDLYRKARKMDWENYMNLSQTLAVSSKVSYSDIHSQYAGLRLKDAIVDYWRDISGGKRPNVDVDDPQVLFYVYINDNRCIISLDSSGESLHHRGYRIESGKAPLNEALAAGILRLTEWNQKAPLIDPLCGSGTFLIEAALWVQNIAPGLIRDDFCCQTWPSFDEKLYRKVKEKVRQDPPLRKTPIFQGYDIDGQVLKKARKNARRAGVGDLIQFEKRDLRDLDLKEGWNATIITNPPYGERLGGEADAYEIHRELGRLFRRCPGYQGYVFTGYEGGEAAIHCDVRRRWKLKSGGLDCKLLEYFIPH